MTTLYMTSTAQLPSDLNVYDDGHLRIEHDNYYVACEGNSIKLPRSQFLIISRLARSPRRIVSSMELWQQAWGEADQSTTPCKYTSYQPNAALFDWPLPVR